MTTAFVAGANAAPTRWMPAVREARDAVRALLERVAAWHQARRRAAADRDALVNMSDRELMDIGVSRGSVHAAADWKWMRDCPH